MNFLDSGSWICVFPCSRQLPVRSCILHSRSFTYLERLEKRRLCWDLLFERKKKKLIIIAPIHSCELYYALFSVRKTVALFTSIVFFKNKLLMLISEKSVFMKLDVPKTRSGWYFSLVHEKRIAKIVNQMTFFSCSLLPHLTSRCISLVIHSRVSFWATKTTVASK